MGNKYTRRMGPFRMKIQGKGKPSSLRKGEGPSLSRRGTRHAREPKNDLCKKNCFPAEKE